MSAPLAGLGILVTRPAHQAAPLTAALAAAGALPLPFPTIAIGPAPDAAAFRAALATIPAAHAAVFVSANAVAAAAPWLTAHGWPAGVRCLAVGPASAAALRELAIGAQIPPARHDSEGLLALPALAPPAVAGRTVVIVRGAGGRELLAKELRRRGAAVVVAEGYTRRGGAADPQRLATWLWARALHAVTVTSRACLAGLVAACPAQVAPQLRALPLAVLAPALAQHARAAGWSGPVLVAPRAADAALVAALIAWRQAQRAQQ